VTISFDIPESIWQELTNRLGDLSHAAKEALAAEGYRAGDLSVGQVAAMLGMGVIEAQSWLSRRGIPLNYTQDDLEADRRTLAGLFPEARQ
jgi:predicted HTH domain antitoxin